MTKVQIYADRQNDDAAFISRVSNAKMSMLGQTSGWYFRIPAKATVAMVECKHTPNDRHDPNDNDTRCLQNPTEIGRERMLIAQYGVVVWLPSKTAGRSSSLSVTLDESTGALKNFKASSSPLLDQSTIENAGNTGEKIIDAADPLAKKKRELERLEIENKINAERKKLETPTPSPTPES